MLRNRSRLSAPLGLFILALALPAARGQSDPIPYQVQPIAAMGTAFQTGGYYVPTGDLHHELLSIDGLNDAGQLLFRAHGDSDAVLVLYSDGHLTPITLPSGPAPGGVWPDMQVTDGSINQQGEVAFAGSAVRGGEWLGLFLWDAQTQQSTQVVLPGLRPVATRSLVFGGSGPYAAGPPLLNNRGDIAFTAPLSDLAGGRLAVGAGLFFRDHQGQVMPVAIAGDTLPGIGTIQYVLASSMNDSGVVGFLAGVTGTDWSAFTWANGKITPVALAGQTLPGGEKVGVVQGVWVNNVSPNVLVDLFPVKNALLYQDGLYLVEGDQITPAAVPGQAMPDGGAYFTSATWPSPGFLTVSAPNAAGQSVFLAVIQEGGRRLSAIYRVDADGQLERLLQDGDTTLGGAKIGVAYGPISLQGAVQNGKGQLALPLATNAASTVYSTFLSAITLLTPTGQ